jgi:hypothetical protein
MKRAFLLSSSSSSFLLLIIISSCCLFGNVFSSSTTTTTSTLSPTPAVVQQQQYGEEDEVVSKKPVERQDETKISSATSNASLTAESLASSADSLVVQDTEHEDREDKKNKDDQQPQEPAKINSDKIKDSSSHNNAAAKDAVNMEEFINLQTNLDECLLQSHQQTVQLSTEVLQTQQLRDKMTAFESKLSMVQSNYDSLVKSSDECMNGRKTLLQDNQDLLKKVQVLEDKYESRASVFQKEKEEMHAKLEQLQAELKQKTNEYYEAREHIHELEKELRMMYDKSETTYVNMNLILQDLGWALMKRIDEAVEFLERIYHSNAVVELQNKVRVAVQPFWKKCLHLYDMHHGKDHVRSLQERLLSRFKAMERVQWTLVSWVQHGSKIVLNYMDLRTMKFATADMIDHKQKESSTSTAPWYAAASNEKLQRRSKTRPRVNLLVRNGLQYAQENAEQVVHAILFFVSVILLSLVWRVVIALLLFGRLVLFGKKNKSSAGNSFNRGTTKRNYKNKKGSSSKNKVE